MSIKNDTVVRAVEIVRARASTVPTTGQEYKELGAAVMVARNALTISRAKTLAGLADLARKVGEGLKSLSAAKSPDWNIDGIPGTNPASIAETWETGVAKAATTQAESVLVRILSTKR